MSKIYDERKEKIDRIIEEYDKRKTQNDIAREFDMSSRHVSWVTQEKNYWHTRKLQNDNLKENEKISPVSFLDDFEYLDKYPIENFR